MQSTPNNSARYNPFWVCLLVFVALAVDSGSSVVRLVSQREQMNASPLAQPENVIKLSQLAAQRTNLEPRLQMLSMDLIQTAQTNAVARQIVQDFNIQWTPPSTGK